MKRFVYVVAMLMSLFGFANQAYAVPIIGVPFAGTVITFDGQTDGTLISNQYAGVTFTQDDGGTPMIDNKDFLFAYESSSGDGVLTGSGTGGGVPTTAGIIGVFDSPVAMAGAFLSDTVPLGDYTVSAYDSLNSLIESYVISYGSSTLPTISNDASCDSTFPWDGTGCGVFIGFSEGSDIIKSIQFGPSSSYGDAFAIDDFTYAYASAVPEPSSLLLLGAGLAGLGLWGRKRLKAIS